MISVKSKELLKTLGIDVSKLDAKKIDAIIKSLSGINAAIESKEEVDIEFSKLDASTLKELGLNAKDFGGHTDEDLELAKKNTRNDQESQIKEILAKEYKKEFGIELDTKDLKEVIKAYGLKESKKTLEEAKIPLDEQLKQKDKDLETIRENLKKRDTEYSELEKERDLHKNKYQEVLDNQEFGSLLPENYNRLLKPSDYRQRLLEEKGVLAKKIDNVWVACNPDGTPMKDKLVQNIPLSTKIKEIFDSTPSWVNVKANEGGGGNGGSGGGHGTGSSGNGGSGGETNSAGIKNMTSFKQHAKEQKWTTGRQQVEYTKVVAENKEFDPNS